MSYNPRKEAHTAAANPSGSILVVDDDAGFCAFVSALLVEAGHATRLAGTGQGALASARAEPPVLVLLDVKLPDLSGFEVCRALRQEHGEALPIVFVSGEAKESFDRVAGLLLGADDYVVKPFAPDELLARVRRLLARSRLTAGSGVEADGLTGRELEVLQLFAAGHGPTEIGRRLGVSPRTVGTHAEHIYRKLGVHSRAQAVARAYRSGLVQGEPPPGDFTPAP